MMAGTSRNMPIGDSGLDTHEIQTMSHCVHSLIEDDNLSRLRVTIRKIPRSLRSRIVNQKIRGNTPLFTASVQGKVHFVNFLLDECDADMELRGIYEVTEDDSTHEVTPLWVAAVANKLEVVKSLVEHGANVNSPSDTKSTPVRSACYMTNISVIKYLAEHGADLHKPNVNGGTCLINAVQSAPLCEFLLEQGVDINAVDNSGNLALHYAIREGMTDTVKLLLKHKSDHTRKNIWGDDALQTAALRGFKVIVDIILEVAGLGTEEAIKANELLGANFIDEKNNIIGGLKLWEKAMCLRYVVPGAPDLPDMPPPKPVYQYHQEPRTLQELKEIQDPDHIYMVALMIRERILGPCHKDTTFGLMYRGAVYADSFQFQRCVDLWKYSYKLRYKEEDPFNNECQFTVQALIKLFWEIDLESGDSSIASIDSLDFLEVFKILSNQIIAGNNHIKTHKDTKLIENVNSLQELMLLYLQMIIHFVGVYRKKNEIPECMNYIHKVLMNRPCGNCGNTLLHLAFESSIYALDSTKPYYTTDIVKVLLSCGADVAAQNHVGDTPLLYALCSMKPVNDNTACVKLMLDAGSHIDTCNKDGESPVDLLKDKNISLCPMNYVTLRCLASKVIKEHKITFKDEIPESLVSYVELHGKYERN
ncbi:Protein fem-1 B [Mactra antiquata]